MSNYQTYDKTLDKKTNKKMLLILKFPHNNITGTLLVFNIRMCNIHHTEFIKMKQ